ncbi:hypothetical protein [Pseudothermotoga thermarum]|uniref:hypothetical protein n=1 Tax=Pseudothermotoga thermarum TaxID=119394 RepID=UPI0002E12AFB|nr:hypothetical protein [Pseudothermotoga thermarum]
MRLEHFGKIFPYIAILGVIVFDGVYFDLFPLLILYMVFEYLRFKSSVDALRVLIVLFIHSAVCFKTITIAHLILLSTYVVFLIVRDYFLNSFVPFFSYVLCVSLIVFLKGSYLPSVLLLCALNLLLWRKYEVS